MVVSKRGELEIGEGGCCMIVGIVCETGENEKGFWEWGVKKGKRVCGEIVSHSVMWF